MIPFYKVQEILEQRSAKNAEKRTISLNTKGPTLLSGNVFCGHCGGRSTASSSSSFYETKAGTKQRYPSRNYVCGNRANRRCDCDGQAGYKISVVDTAIENMIINILSNIADTPESVAIAKTYETRIAEIKQRVKRLSSELNKSDEKITALTNEIVNVLMGNSVFTKEQLDVNLENVKNEKAHTEEELRDCTKRLENFNVEKESAKNGYAKLTTWAQEYSMANIERKKMIIAEIFDRVELRKGYEIEVIMNQIYRPYVTAGEV